MRTRFPHSLGVSVLLHVLAALAVFAVISYRPKPIHLQAVDQDLSHAIAVTLTPLHHPQPRLQPPKPQAHVTPKPQPPAISSEATESEEQVPPPAVKPTPPTPPEVQQPEPQQQATYQEIAEAILAANKRYPREALIGGIEGTVELSYIVNSQGTVLAYTIEQSSGHPVLDDEVKRLISSVRFPPFPPGDTDSRKTLEVTIEFTLKGDLSN